MASPSPDTLETNNLTECATPVSGIDFLLHPLWYQMQVSPSTNGSGTKLSHVVAAKVIGDGGQLSRPPHGRRGVSRKC
jgi:hypothetical protein